MRGLLATSVEGLRVLYRQLRAVELVVEEVAAEFDGEDPLAPFVRSTLDSAKEELAELRVSLETSVTQFDVTEPDEEDLKCLRDILKHAAKLRA